MDGAYHASVNTVIDIIEMDWFDNVIGPYSSAYATAHSQYERVVEAQKQVYQSRADMLLLAASLIGGSVLTAVFATSALKALTVRAGDGIALRVLCEKNLTRLFDRYVMLRSSPTASFFAGEVLSALEKYAANKTRSAIASIVAVQEGEAKLLAGHAVQRIMTSPQQTQNELQFFVNSFIKAAKRVLLQIQLAQDLTADQKVSAVEAMFRSPGLRPPACPVSYKPSDIELSFYLGLLVNSDQLCDFTAGLGYLRAANCTPITALPNQAGYPNWKTPARTTVVGSSFKVEWTGVDMLLFGDTFRTRIEKLYEPFSEDGGGLYGTTGGGAEVLRRAHTALEVIGNKRFAQPGPIRTALQGAARAGMCEDENEASSARASFPGI